MRSAHWEAILEVKMPSVYREFRREVGQGKSEGFVGCEPPPDPKDGLRRGENQRSIESTNVSIRTSE